MASRVLIVGGTGFLGAMIRRLLTERGDEVTITSRRPAPPRRPDPDGVARLVWGPRQPFPEGHGFDAIINLAGANLFGKRWTARYKDEVYQSRIETTKRLVAAMPDMRPTPRVLVNASAVGYYGFPDADRLDEGAPPGDDFLARLCQDWESAAQEAEVHGARVVCLRYAILFGRGDGALGRLEPIFKFGVGGTIGRGHHAMPWVSIDDAAQATLYAIDHEDMTGAYNVAAPSHDTNRDFTKAYARALHRPAILPVPPFMLALLYGEGADVLTDGRHIESGRLAAAGYSFRHPDLETAFAALYGG